MNAVKVYQVVLSYVLILLEATLAAVTVGMNWTQIIIPVLILMNVLLIMEDVNILV